MNLNDVHRGVHKNKSRKRLGRGHGSGQGKTAGRGHKGQKSRNGYWAPVTFEGGQMPLVRRVPKRGFHNRFALSVAVVNLADLETRFQAGEEVNPQTLKSKGLAKGAFDAAEGAGRRPAHQGAEGFRPPLQPHGRGEDPAGRRPDRGAARGGPGRKEQAEEQARSQELAVSSNRCSAGLAGQL